MAGLFGARRPAFTDIQIPVDAPAQIPVAAAPPRRGLFGRLGSAVTPRNLMVVGATLQELGGRRGALGGQIEALSEQAQQQWERQRAEQQDAWQAEQQARQRNVWGAQDRIAATAPPEQRDLVTADPGAFIQQRGARDQYAWQRQYDNTNPEAITPYQQAQLDLTRRGQDVSVNNARLTQQSRPLRGPDAQQMTRIRESGESARGLRAIVGEFASALENQDTGPGAGVQIWDPEVRNMTALAARMTGLMRPVGSGATSDFEQRLYARGAPSIDNTREANRQIIAGINRLADISDARQFFYEDYAAAYGTLNGAERAFQASPDFQALTSGQAETPNGGQGFTNQNGQPVDGAGRRMNDPLGIR